ncbi:Zinc finger, GATA-type [Cynara cardunculus var. scolymus]|uniref:Zinc finger, GATA-type n=1 Tax=Cynara cardunculus var. scolymus TaxID=59895 RepID=A0A103XDB5_CYNCS|nr:Zinc finger, GATA-type [Cynara cardunculus var. scolymus]
MGKQGPCYHCGVTSTPLWRNGPPDKPILCNACGSRWRTKGSLVNYTPLHARSEPDDFEDHRVSRVKTISIKNKEAKLLKRKQNYDNVVGGSGSIMLGGGGFGGGLAHDHHNQGFRKGFDEDTSNRSSSGSAISNSDGYMQLGSADASDLTGPAQSSVVWDTLVPSRKRTCVNRLKQSPVEKLTKDLHTILHEQQSYFSGSSEEDLIFESDTPMVSVEIGHGSVLMRHPNSMAREEESEASSLSVDTKNEAYSRLTTLPVYNANKGGNFSSRRIDTSKKPMNQDHMNRDNDEKLQILMNHNSPLCHIDLKDVINFEEFASHMTKDEQQQLLKYLPLVDNAQLYNSPQFMENLSSFQKLLAEGVFDLSFPVVKNEGCRTLKKLALCNVTKSDWVEKYNLLQDTKCKYDGGGSVVGGVRNAMTPGHSVKLKRSRDAQFQAYTGPKTAMKSPKRTSMKTNYEHKEVTDNDGPGFSPRSLFALPPDNSSLMLDSLRYADESCDQDLLLDVPSNNSFPQAELLRPTLSFPAAQASTCSSSIYQNFVGR